ncbi:MAG: UDP-N-acetylmuramoyl-tripeptide--D-alanyl-D-alanine ligase [Clostridiales bacterium]|nr:UDP-N-acetylmuramoyl-tripeptide--D-alanyl-D-alanine ligase [Clostridiales bacterium]
MELYIAYSLIAVAAALTGFTALPMLKILQLSGYKAKGVVAWWKDTSFDVLIRYASLMLFGFIAMIIFVACFHTFEYVRYCAVAFYILLAVTFIVAEAKSGSNNVKFTGRIARMLAVDCVIMLGLGALVAWATYFSPYCQTLAAALAVFSPFVAIISNYIMLPFEKLNNRKYVKRAKAKLADKKPVVIGITGSFGKTTAKNMLNAMLLTTHTVLATPASYNTPMGVCKTINNDLGDENYFIAELGARYKGDIKELCDIVSPKYGIITAIGDMHLQTLGSRENVANVKFELGKALPEDGLLVLNGYNNDCAVLYDREVSCRKIKTGESEISFDKLVIDGNGTSFELIIGNERFNVNCKLLGAHIPELVCACAAVAVECGVSGENIAKAVNGMPQVKHRLELVPSVDPAVTVIDDGYNSNPVGARNALNVIKRMAGNKIIITPGFVELGPIEKQCNTELGADIAGVCDYAFLVGSRSKEIKKGALNAGMNEDNIKVFDSRDSAVAALKDITGEKVVLFENDLPDNIK